MNLKWFGATWASSIKTNLGLTISNVVLVLLLFIVYSDSASKKPEIVFVPPSVDAEMRVGMNSANKAYMESFGMYVATLVGNATPSNVDFVVTVLSQFFDSGKYPDLRKTILSTAATRAFKETASASKFEPQSVHFEAQANKVFVSGEMRVVSVSGGQTPRAVTYEMEMRIIERRPVVFDLISYDGMEPHTKLWQENHPEINLQKEEK